MILIEVHLHVSCSPIISAFFKFLKYETFFVAEKLENQSMIMMKRLSRNLVVSIINVIDKKTDHGFIKRV